MDWKFWSRKKRKRLELAEAAALAKLEEFRESLRRSDEVLRVAEEMKCPPVMEATHLCVCKNCPKRGVCQIEKICRAGGCTNNFITECSLKKSITGELDGEKKEGSDGDNGPFTGISGILTQKLCGESTGGRLRETRMVSADGESSLRLDNIGEN
jgi:hypothetical protein